MRRDEMPIPSPCSADWNAMEPRDRARFCDACSLEVVDVSAHTEAEARALLTSRSSDRVCVSYIVRPDGTLKLAKDPRAPDVAAGSLRRRGASLLAAASLALAACDGTTLDAIEPGPVRLAGEPLRTVEPVADGANGTNGTNGIAAEGADATGPRGGGDEARLLGRPASPQKDPSPRSSDEPCDPLGEGDVRIAGGLQPMPQPPTPSVDGGVAPR